MKLSYSSYSIYRTCPLRYRLEREYPLRGPEFAELRIGKYMHDYFYRVLEFEDVENDAERIWEEMKCNRRILHHDELVQEFEDFEDMQSYYSSLNDALILGMSEEGYIKKIERIITTIPRMASRFRGRKYRKEAYLHNEMDGVRLFGFVDLLGEDDIVELKTGRIDGYELQLKFYSLLFYLRKYMVPRSVIVSLYTGEIQEMKFTVKSLEDLYSEIMKEVERLRRGIFTPRRGEWCRYCPYRSLCELQ